MSGLLDDLRPNLDKIVKPFFTQLKAADDKIEAVNASVIKLEADKAEGNRPKGFAPMRIPKWLHVTHAGLENQLKTINERALSEMMTNVLVARTALKDSLQTDRNKIMDEIKTKVTDAIDFVAESADIGNAAAIGIQTLFVTEVEERLTDQQRKSKLQAAFKEFAAKDKKSEEDLDRARNPPTEVTDDDELKKLQVEMATLKKTLHTLHGTIQQLPRGGSGGRTGKNSTQNSTPNSGGNPSKNSPKGKKKGQAPNNPKAPKAPKAPRAPKKGQGNRQGKGQGV